MATTKAVQGVVSADVLARHLQEIIVEYESYKQQFRRSENREPVSIPVEAVELDNDWNPVSEPFHMVTRDMSAHGSGIFYNHQLTCPFVKLQFCSPVSLETFSVVAKVEHCTPCGKYYLIGCRFMAD